MTTSTNPPNQPFSTPRRRFAAIGALCLGVFALGTAFQAATATPAASRAVGPTSVAIVNLNRIAEGLDEMKEKLDKLKADVDAYNARLDDLKKRITDIKTEISTMGDPTTEQAIRARRAKLQEQLELEVLLKARQESLQQMLDLEIGSLMRQAYFKIEAACKQLGESEGWDLIMIDDRDGLPENLTRQQFRQATEGRQVLYVNPTIDITDQLITMMNNAYRANLQ